MTRRPRIAAHLGADGAPHRAPHRPSLGAPDRCAGLVLDRLLRRARSSPVLRQLVPGVVLNPGDSTDVRHRCRTTAGATPSRACTTSSIASTTSAARSRAGSGITLPGARSSRALMVGACLLIIFPPRGGDGDEYVRGTDVIPSRRLRRDLRGDGVELGGILIPRKLESQHFLLVGAPGSGKSTAIRRMLRQIEARGEMRRSCSIPSASTCPSSTVPSAAT